MEFQESFGLPQDWGCPEQDFLLGASSTPALNWAASPQSQLTASPPGDYGMPQTPSPLHNLSDGLVMDETAFESIFGNSLPNSDEFLDVMEFDPAALFPQLAPGDVQQVLTPEQPKITIKTKRVKPSSFDYLVQSPSTCPPQEVLSQSPISTVPDTCPPQEILCQSPASSVPDTLLTLKDIFESEESAAELFENLLQSDSSSSGSDSSAPSSPESSTCRSPASFYDLSPSTAGPEKHTKRGRGRSRASTKEDMYQRKKEQNKQAATRYRQKKKEEENAMLAELANEEATNKSLRKDLKETKMHLDFLKKLIRKALIAKHVVNPEVFERKPKTSQPSASTYLPSSSLG